ncbi:DEAD/DEAH box helicase [Sphaerisporangium corydalis]|uniref:SNF2-related protein n=1 Tax=Sphaerisporangium corydalis TaxID=1441875 RepID=A0ABV9E7R1_9ACTN|nr:DEAD/DEAH box helicase [Sphaerisporangium corydalis]
MGEVTAGEARAPTTRQARAILLQAGRLLSESRTLLADHARARDEVQRALAGLRAELARDELAAIPVARLKDVTGGRLRLGAIEQAGYATVKDVLDATPYALQLVPGVGARTAAQVIAAAGQIARAAEETVTLRIDVERRDPRATALLVALNRLVTAGPDLTRACDAATAVDARLTPLLPGARPAQGWLRMMLAGRAGRERARESLARIGAFLAESAASGTRMLLAQAAVDLLRPPVQAVEAWIDFEIQAPEYYSLLAEIAALEPDRVASEGFVPSDLSARVNAQALDDTHRRVSLRGYQAFGARFALAQGRVILGDEMGLGKTIQAIAALAHLRAGGHTHFLVACPASVLINWCREIETRSTLRPFRVHGSDRTGALAEWVRGGGVAVTTIDALHRLEVPAEVTLGMLVVDEAHYVKNPEARRSLAVARWCARTGRVLFLTGTPMENRVEEFRTLVGYLRPEMVPEIRASDAAAGPEAFRRAVAPAYLRRNQQDVLTELPDLVHVDEWEELSAADSDAYRAAVAAGNFMAMRRAAYAVPEKSAKLERLCEIVEEAAGTGLKVVVFSYFRDVLSTVRTALTPANPTGDLAPEAVSPTQDATEPTRDTADPVRGGAGPVWGAAGPVWGAAGPIQDAADPARGAAGRVHGPISGGLPPARRQEIVDEFTGADGHAVLLCQIQAGGVGLNLQAASVVVLCEPQVKPTMESQAVARAHRMGQVRKVQVHRILAADSVDQRMLEILRTKSRLFDAYARRSDLAESAPDALDVSEQSLAREIVEAEQRRLALSTTDS